MMSVLSDFEKVPQFGWKVNLDHTYEEHKSPFCLPRIKQIIYLLPLLVRYFIYNVSCIICGRVPVMDFLRLRKAQQKYGVPFGGIGGGSIGRGFRGEFCRFQMIPGLYDYDTAEANQFILTIRDEDKKTVFQQVLSAAVEPRKSGALSSWDWNFPGKNASYTGLFPRSWTEYNIPEHNLRLICRQVSPVIPHNYKDSCLPGGVFLWTCENNSDTLKNVTITFTFSSGCGNNKHVSDSCETDSFSSKGNLAQVSGATIKQKLNNMNCSYSIAALKNVEQNITVTTYFDPAGSGETLWETLKCDGNLSALNQTSHIGKNVGVAVACECQISPGGASNAQFALTWDMPVIKFLESPKTFTRYYTKYFGSEGSNSPSMCEYALENYTKWEKEIFQWQQPTLNSTTLPSWYKSAIFNELYYVADGGTQWLLMDDVDELPSTDIRIEYGRFGYLEGHEYMMYNTYDVHFYASWALIQLWPRLQESIQYEFRSTIDYQSLDTRKNLYNGKPMYRKVKHTIPHDLGAPGENPWLEINAYPVHDVCEWRDLNLKFVLQCYRDYSLTKNIKYLGDMWPQLNSVMEYSLKWDSDNDGMIENGGFPDQTYDAWTMTGVSAYCGSLYFASCFAMSKMGEALGDAEASALYHTRFSTATEVFVKKLWNGQYYNFDCSSGPGHQSVMADQLCGLWYLRASGVKDEILPNDQVKSALQTIFNLNVKCFQNGTMGAVNGMLPDGSIDVSAIQSEEMWTGVSYGLAAFFIHENMESEGFTTGAGVYKTTYYTTGLAFETPEAFYENKKYRSIGYMRPLSIWAINRALTPS
nr:PREDICTED: non-lysosomal glucosylceramidase [Bemisia tabaci]